MSRIAVYRPDEPPAPAEPVSAAPRAAPGDAVVLGLVDNGKPRARELLLAIAEELGARLPLAEVEVVGKLSAGKPLEADAARGLAARARLVITGVGD